MGAFKVLKDPGHGDDSTIRRQSSVDRRPGQASVQSYRCILETFAEASGHRARVFDYGVFG